MSGLAHLLLDLGQTVSGSDWILSAAAEELMARGATVFEGHRPEQIAGADLVAVTSAARPDNPEWQAALEAGIPVWKRPELLRHLASLKATLAVAGTHGKTTTTAMLALLLIQAGKHPAYLIGGPVPDLGRSARWDVGEFLVIEADEYDRTFHAFSPTLAVITNVEWDHVDCYPTAAECFEAFRIFAAQTVPGGLVILCADDPGAVRLAHQLRAEGLPLATYGLSGGACLSAADLAVDSAGRTHYTLLRGKDPIGRFVLQVPGEHNVRNALAALLSAERVGLDLATAARGLAEFRGVGRRFEWQGDAAGVTVIDDYAHHPGEIAATLAAARARYPRRRLVAVFQPHTYSRTRTFLEGFAASLAAADLVLVTDIYAARETDSQDVHAREVAARVKGPEALYSGGLPETVAQLEERVQPGDVVLVLGAGTSVQIGKELLRRLTITP
jgi:UDP-N-acetylmuramate--alanine ligase